MSPLATKLATLLPLLALPALGPVSAGELSEIRSCLGVIDRLNSPAAAQKCAEGGRALETETLKTAILPTIPGFTGRARFVAMTVNDRPCWFILDTGSNANVLSKSAVKRLGLANANADRASAVGSGHTGESVPYDYVKPFSARLGGSARNLDPIRAISLDMPPTYDETGICGMLSPQTLRDFGDVTLDFASATLTIVSTGGAESARKTHPDMRALKLDVASPGAEGEYEKPPLLVSAALAGRPAQNVLIDSGSPYTEFGPDYVRGMKTRPGPWVGSFSGEPIQTQVVENQTLELGGEKLAIKEVVLVPQRPRVDGLIGMDILDRSVLVIPRDKQPRPLILFVPR